MAVVVIAPNATIAAAFSPALTVEAEYGSVVAEGSRYTAAHHQPSGPFAGRHIVEGGRPSPCNDPAIPLLGEQEVILLSHFDLDSVGGALRAFPEFVDLFGEENADFWEMAEWVDVRGAHKLPDAPLHGQVLYLQAFWAWSKANLPFYSRTEVTDVTSNIIAAGEALRRILSGDRDLLTAGAVFAAKEADLNEDTFVLSEDSIILRVSHDPRAFCNHLYRTPSGVLSRGVVVLNTHTGTITVSIPDAVAGLSCATIVKGLWGPEAGGHPGIAGSPRGQVMKLADAVAAITALASAIRAAEGAEGAV